MSKLLKNDRLEFIVKTVNEKGRTRVMELANLLKVTDETIRNDLKILVRQGKVSKVHGGAEPLFPKRGVNGSTHSKVQINIARTAASLIQDDEVIFIDGSEESIALSKFIQDQPLTVYTNSPEVMMNLAIHPEIKVVGIGGTLDHRTRTLLPDQDVPFPSVIFSNVFFSCDAFNTSHGMMVRSKENANFLAKILDQSPLKRTLMIEKDTIHSHANFLLPFMTVGSTIVLNQEPDHEDCRNLSSVGYNVITC